MAHWQRLGQSSGKPPGHLSIPLLSCRKFPGLSEHSPPSRPFPHPNPSPLQTLLQSPVRFLHSCSEPPPLSLGMFLKLMSDRGFPLFHTCSGSRHPPEKARPCGWQNNDPQRQPRPNAGPCECVLFHEVMKSGVLRRGDDAGPSGRPPSSQGSMRCGRPRQERLRGRGTGNAGGPRTLDGARGLRKRTSDPRNCSAVNACRSKLSITTPAPFRKARPPSSPEGASPLPRCPELRAP